MILDYRIFNLYEEELFKKSFFSILSADQQKSIDIAIPTLFRIFKNLSNITDINFKVFSVSGVFLHIYIHSEKIHLITTSYGYNYPIFNSFVEKVSNLIERIEKTQPSFELFSNTFFINEIEREKNDIENSIENEYQDKKLTQITEDTKKTRESLINKERNKYLIMGAGAAGKSSIIAQFFENWDQEQILNIKPTVLSKINQFADDYTKESFVVHDLAGQSLYRKKHLESPKNFENIRCLIFVIDIQNVKNSTTVKDYFIGILDKLVEFKQNPLISIFLHKYDPAIRDQFSPQILFWIEWIETLFEKSEYQNLQINYHFSSVKDNTAREAIARTLLFTLPHWFLSQTLQKELIVKSANSLYPVFGQFQNVLSEDEQKEINDEIFRASHVFGLEIAKSIVNDWIKFMIKDEKFLQEMGNSLVPSEVSLEPDEIDRKFKFCFQCPLKEELKVDSAVCEITHGLFTGVGQLIGFPNIKILQTQIRDKTDDCKIEISY